MSHIWMQPRGGKLPKRDTKSKGNFIQKVRVDVEQRAFE